MGYRAPLHLVPNPVDDYLDTYVEETRQSLSERHQAQFDAALRPLHIFRGVARQQRETEHLIAEAEKAGNKEAAERLKTALAALRDAEESLRV